MIDGLYLQDCRRGQPTSYCHCTHCGAEVLGKGALPGGTPRTREGRRPDRVELQWSVVSGQWSVVSGQWSVVSGQWSVVSGQWSVVSGQWSVVSGQWSVVSGQWSVVSGQWVSGQWSVKAGVERVVRIPDSRRRSEWRSFCRGRGWRGPLVMSFFEVRELFGYQLCLIAIGKV